MRYSEKSIKFGAVCKAFLIYSFGGPLVGLALYILFFNIYSIVILKSKLVSIFDFHSFDIAFLKIITIASYYIGTPPASTSGLFYIFLVYFINDGLSRTVLAPQIGALSIAIWAKFYNPCLLLLAGESMLYAAIHGALTSLICAIITEWSIAAARFKER